MIGGGVAAWPLAARAQLAATLNRSQRDWEPNANGLSSISPA
jgi:hypothetical protein